MAPEPIEPETKSWTWVLDRECPECGFDASAFDVRTTGAVVRDLAHRWQLVLERPGCAVRPSPGVWSPLEYACHVRDVLGIFDARLQRMLHEDDPEFDNWDQDRTAVEQRYDLQDPSEVASALSERAAAVSERFDGVAPSQWLRPGRRSDGAVFTVDSFARYFVHDPVHHLWDVTDFAG